MTRFESQRFTDFPTVVGINQEWQTGRQPFMIAPAGDETAASKVSP
jgi:hypothetical protein